MITVDAQPPATHLFAFKQVFSSERSHDILLISLNAIPGLQLPYRIATLTRFNLYLQPKIQEMRDTYLG